jgi:hypothetical protein
VKLEPVVAQDPLAAMETLVVRVSPVALEFLAALEPLVVRNLSPWCLRESPEKPIGSGAEPRRWSPWE